MADHYGPDELISLEEAGQLVGLSPTSLRVYASQGKLQAIKRGGRNWTTRRWLHAYMEDRRESGRGRPPRDLPPGYRSPEPGRPARPRLRPPARTPRNRAQEPQEAPEP